MAMCLASLRCSVDLINAGRDTMFGQRAPTPSRESLQDMEYMMKQGRYHIGIATDGDSDRIGLYDEKGNYIEANEILKLLYYYLKAYRGENGGLVRNVTTSHVLDRIAHSFGEPAPWRRKQWRFEDPRSCEWKGRNLGSPFGRRNAGQDR
jgi:phosphomannomutase